MSDPQQAVAVAVVGDRLAVAVVGANHAVAVAVVGVKQTEMSKYCVGDMSLSHLRVVAE